MHTRLFVRSRTRLAGLAVTAVTALTTAPFAAQADIRAVAVAADASKPDPAAAYWANAPAEKIVLIAQPMAVPRPATTATAELQVQAVHNRDHLAIRLSWQDDDRSEAGHLGEFSDAVAVEFPVKSNEAPPPVFMGTVDNPVHIFHWRAQYQRDAEQGKPTMKDLYPNASIDIYPLEFKDPGTLGQSPEAAREQFSPGRAEGNPQSYAKSGVDEIVAEGFSTSAVQEGHGSAGKGVHAGGRWSVVISRELRREGGSVLTAGGKTFVGFAVWQGGKDEVGSRKSVTMVWTPLALDPDAAAPAAAAAGGGTR